ncbi:MAG: bacillithiol biosynthesis deacetylase BshB1 [Aequorivita sp.]
MKIDILAIGAHPDDVELGCAATLAKEISLGKQVGILDLTRGELGTRGTPEIRAEEAANAAEILGAKFRHNLEFSDGFLINNAASKLEIIKMIRKYRPEIVLCNAITDRHIDHGKASQMVSDACFLSGLEKILTIQDDNHQKAWRPKHVYHYIQWKNIEPDFVVDVTGFMEKKLEAVFAYKSQFHQKEAEEPETPISSTNFRDSIKYRAQDLGRLIGTEYGEGFTVERYVAVNALSDLI